MSRENIIQTLSAAKSLTLANIQALRSKNTDAAFLAELVAIYEQKASNYLNGCNRNLTKYIAEKKSYPKEHIEEMAAQHAIEFTYSSTLEASKGLLFKSLAQLLKLGSPELAISLGLPAGYKAMAGLDMHYAQKTQISPVFIKYFARYRLALEISPQDLYALCVAANADNSNHFPLYLLQSLLQQNAIDTELNASVAGQPTPQGGTEVVWSREIARSITAHPELYYQCMKGLVFYISMVVKDTRISTEQQGAFFGHLNYQATTLQFVDVISRGYIHAMSAEQKVSLVYTKNRETANSEFRLACIPMLPFLGVKVTISSYGIAARKTVIEQSLASLQTEKDTINTMARTTLSDYRTAHAKYSGDISASLSNLNAAAASKAQEAHSAIQKARDDFKPQWTISGNTGPTINF